MRYLRLGTVFVFVAVLILSGWTLYQDIVSDKVKPTITDSLESLSVSVADPQEALLQGLTATDDRDGDLTQQIVVDRISQFTEKGVVDVDYVVFDKAGNMCRYTRSVRYADYESPKLVLEKPLVYYVGQNIAIMDRLKLIDCLGGDITHRLKIHDSNVDAGQVGQYEFVASAVTDMGDEVQVRLPVNIMQYDGSAPVIELSEHLIYAKVGEKINPADYVTKLHDLNGFPIDLNLVFVFSQVDMSQPGSGQYRLEVLDGYGRKGYSYLSVIVTE